MKKYSYLPGALLLVVGAFRASFLGGWDTADVLLIVGGLSIMALSVAANWRELREWFAEPGGVYAMNTALSIVLLFAVLVAINGVAFLRQSQLDWTQSGRNTLSAETRVILAGLTQDVTLAQFGRNPDPAIGNVLSTFAGQSRRIRTTFVDAEQAPQEARKYGVLRPGTIVIKAGEKFRKVERATESSLSTAIVQATSSIEPIICFATGDGEHEMSDQSGAGLSRLADVLAASNFTLDSRSLLEGDVPSRCTALVIAGLKSDLQPVQTGRLDRYLDLGGRVALLIDPAPAPSIVEWMKRFGFTTGTGLVIEASPAAQAVGGSPETPLAMAYGDHPITRGFGVATLYDRAVPLASEDQSRVIAWSGRQSFERVDLVRESPVFREGRDRRGPFALAVAASWPSGPRRPQGGESRLTTEARLVVFGDSDFITNTYLGRQGNRDLFVRAVAWLAGQEEARIVSVLDRENRRTELTERMRIVMYAVNLGLLPLVPLAAGIVQFLRSKR
jgi:ABC-type uncharacterized transport system involved in gliding motility auxiliary subunit